MRPQNAAHWMAMLSCGQIDPMNFMPKWARDNPGSIMRDLFNVLNSGIKPDSAIEKVAERYDMSRERLIRLVESVGSGDPKWDRLCSKLNIS